MTETTIYTSKAEAYKALILGAREKAGNAGNDALAYIADKAAKDAMMFLGRFHGAAWLTTNKTWRIDEYMRTVEIIGRGIGRSLSGFEKDIVRNAMMPVFRSVG